MGSHESRRTNRLRRLAAALALGLSLTPWAQASAQSALDLGGALLADGEEIRYLRALALSDSSIRSPMMLQPFGRRGEAMARRAAAEAVHPWQGRFARAGESTSEHGFSWAVLRPDVQAVFLSDRPSQRADGVMWTGRGATIAAQGGLRAEWRWVRMQVAPAAFASQNAKFSLLQNGSANTYGDPRFAGNIDLPQRFGDDAYARLDWGDSFVEAEALGLTAGFSNARQHWGPAARYPLVLGTGSGGFAHVHFGTASPMRTPAGDLQFRWLLGRLEQSSYSPVQTGETARSLVGFLGSFSPSFAPALEIGGSRIINGPWPRGGLRLSALARPFEGIVNDNAGPINKNSDNGFASLFVRVAPLGLGVEAYAELSREDFAGDVRQLYLEPDDLVHYTLGVARATGSAKDVRVLRFELVNGEVAHQERAGRGLAAPFPPYTHSPTVQGLTNRGQLLGSFGAYGGAAATISWQRFIPDGSQRLEVERLLLHDWLPAFGATGGVEAGEIRYALRAERLVFRGDADVTLSAGLAYTLNRGLVERHDVFGIELGARWRGW